MRFHISGLFWVITAVALLLSLIVPLGAEPDVVFAILYLPCPMVAWLLLTWLLDTDARSRHTAFASCLVGVAGTVLLFRCWRESTDPYGVGMPYVIIEWAMVTSAAWLPQLFFIAFVNRDLRSIDSRLVRPVSPLPKSPAKVQAHDSEIASPP